jgi:hypothetical protein
MSEKRPIDLKRDSGGIFDIGTPDEGPIGSMVEIDDSLYIIKPNAIYALNTADKIDPDRTNIALPKVVTRQVFAVGSDSEIVGKILLTAVSLLDKGKFVREGVDYQRAVSISLDALTIVVTMTTMASDFEMAQDTACERASAQQRSGHAEQQPFLGDAKARCKAFMQQADHAAGALLDIVRLFYPDIKDAPWDALYEKVSQDLGDDDAFAKFLTEAIPFFKLVRNTRNCLDHRNLKGVTVKDFEVQSDGEVHPPTIEIDFRGSKHSVVAVSVFMNGVITSLANGFEMMLAHLCNANSRPLRAPMPIYIQMPAENRRRWKHVRFYYGSSFNGEFIPVG